MLTPECSNTPAFQLLVYASSFSFFTSHVLFCFNCKIFQTHKIPLLTWFLSPPLHSNSSKFNNEFQVTKPNGHLSVLIFLELSEAFKAVAHSLLQTCFLLTITTPHSSFSIFLVVPSLVSLVGSHF